MQLRTVLVNRPVKREEKFVEMVHVADASELFFQDVVRHGHRCEHTLLDTLLLRVITVVKDADAPLVLASYDVAVEHEIRVAVVVDRNQFEVVVAVMVTRVITAFAVEGEQRNHHIFRHIIFPKVAVADEDKVLLVPT